MASGSQVCKKICADLPMAPSKNKKVIKVIAFVEVVLFSKKKGVNANNTGKVTSRNTQKHKIIPNVKATSAILFTNKAFNADRVALIRENQNPIKRNEQTPTPSHPRKRTSKLSAVTKSNIKKVKRDKYDINLGKCGSSAI